MTFSNRLLSVSIAVATLANGLLIASNAPIVGIWGLLMQICYMILLDSLPYINIRSHIFHALCVGVYIQKCLWFYYIPQPSPAEMVLMLLAVWTSPFLFIILGSPGTRNVETDCDLECGVRYSSKTRP